MNFHRTKTSMTADEILRSRVESFVLRHLNKGHSIFLTEDVQQAMSLSPSSCFTNAVDPTVDRLLAGHEIIISWAYPFRTIRRVKLDGAHIAETEVVDEPVDAR